MLEKDVTRIDTTMNNLVELTREQNTTLNKMLVMQTTTSTNQAADSKRIDKLESHNTWTVRLIIGGLVSATFAIAIFVIKTT